MGFGSLHPVKSLSFSPSYYSLVRFHWRAGMGKWSLTHLFDRDAVSKAMLHVHSACATESAALVTHILCKLRSTRLETVEGGGEAHGQWA